MRSWLHACRPTVVCEPLPRPFAAPTVAFAASHAFSEDHLHQSMYGKSAVIWVPKNERMMTERRDGVMERHAITPDVF